VAPLLDFHRRLLAEGIKAGEFRNVIRAVLHRLVGLRPSVLRRHRCPRAIGVGPVTEKSAANTSSTLEALICGGLLNTNNEKAAAATE